MINETAMDGIISYPLSNKQARQDHIVRHLGQDNILNRTERVFSIASHSPILMNNTQLTITIAASPHIVRPLQG